MDGDFGDNSDADEEDDWDFFAWVAALFDEEETDDFGLPAPKLAAKTAPAPSSKRGGKGVVQKLTDLVDWITDTLFGEEESDDDDFDLPKPKKAAGKPTKAAKAAKLTKDEESFFRDFDDDEL